MTNINNMQNKCFKMSYFNTSIALFMILLIYLEIVNNLTLNYLSKITT